jgi:type VI secretion system protein ImpL
VILPLIPEVAAQSALDRAVFAGGCAESSETSVPALEQDILKLYSDDFIAQWDGFLRDVRLAPITDLTVATANLKDLASPDSTLKRLLTAVVTETDLLAVPRNPRAAATPPTGRVGLLGAVAGRPTRRAGACPPGRPAGQRLSIICAAEGHGDRGDAHR